MPGGAPLIAAVPVAAAAPPPSASSSSSHPRQPETRDEYASERSIGMKTNVARSYDSVDDQVSPVNGPRPAAPGASAAKTDSFAKLVIQRGRSTGKEFTLADDEIYIGRWDADGGIFPDIDLDADDPEAKVSRRHARITRRDNQFYIEDLGSTNGTFINRGRRLLPGDRQAINDGDEIIIGKTFMKFTTAK
ncbi:MAG TPA: FHA domain-containing protein [Pyrinomonadaceae bacterium]|nr:FHA domain-containing protein [Pyrinomonadaceae bacterium]